MSRINTFCKVKTDLAYSRCVPHLDLFNPCRVEGGCGKQSLMMK